MAFASRIEAHSVNAFGVELMTVVWTIPRRVLAEANTHRTLSDGVRVEFSERTFPENLSKNSSSYRAIPVQKMLDSIKNDPYIPKFGINTRGMQSREDATDITKFRAELLWVTMAKFCSKWVEKLQDLNIHKQDANGPLEPFGWITQVLTGDQYAWANFFALRCHQDAHPALRKAARTLYLQSKKSTPRLLKADEWHLPLVKDEEKIGHTFQTCGVRTPDQLDDLLKKSVARCAWVSYNAHDGLGDDAKIQRTIETLSAQGPVHASPFEHQATPAGGWAWTSPTNLSGNLHPSWMQLRKFLQREQAFSYDPSPEELATWSDVDGDLLNDIKNAS